MSKVAIKSIFCDAASGVTNGPSSLNFIELVLLRLQ
jgi:hypothetical protein